MEQRKLILGGVEIPFEKGLLGHSDADVLLSLIHIFCSVPSRRMPLVYARFMCSILFPLYF